MDLSPLDSTAVYFLDYNITILLSNSEWKEAYDQCHQTLQVVFAFVVINKIYKGMTSHLVIDKRTNIIYIHLIAAEFLKLDYQFFYMWAEL